MVRPVRQVGGTIEKLGRRGIGFLPLAEAIGAPDANVHFFFHVLGVRTAHRPGLPGFNMLLHLPWLNYGFTPGAGLR